ncbi:MAG: PQQ-binding-like beta-propeller repeat protein [Mariniblastus sp.]
MTQLRIVATIFFASLSLANGLLAQQSKVDFDISKHNNWHQWRGPNASGVASKGNPPTSWSEDSNVKWKTAIEGEGSSTPIIWDDQVFVLSAIETDRLPKVPVTPHPEIIPQPPKHTVEFVVWSFDRHTGKLQWKKVVTEQTAHESHHQSTTFAAASPTTDGNFLYASFGSYGIFCLTFDGELVWEKDLGDMRTRRGWGEAVSPVLHDGRLVVNWDQEDQSQIFVLNAKNGDVIWKLDREEPTTWATPLITQSKESGAMQLITNGTKAVRSYNLETGDLIWKSPGTTLNAIPCPVQFGNNVICMAGYRGSMAYSIDLASSGEISSDKIGKDQPLKWKIPQYTPYVPSPIVLDGRLYFNRSLAATIGCYDATTGKSIYEKPVRLPGLKSLYASPVAVSDRIYFTSREGKTIVLRGGDDFEVIKTNSLDEGIDASPAIVGDQIFLRGTKHLYCIESSE